MVENKSTKRKLIIQSFAPLFLILAIKNLTWGLLPPMVALIRHLKENDWGILCRIWSHPMFCTYMLELICIVWIIYALISIHSFSNWQTAGFKSQGEKVIDINRISDSGVTFFMTYVLPMALDDIGTLKGFAVFAILMVMLCALMWKTNLYYQNPILTILGYHVVSFQFSHTELEDFKNRECIGITRGEITDGVVIKRKYITDNVFLIYKDSVNDNER